MARVVALTGTPGTGKTTVAARLEDVTAVDVNRVARDAGLVDADGGVDVDELDDALRARTSDLQGDVVLEGHLSHHATFLDGIVVLRCRPSNLRERLADRAWSETKLRENLEAEAVGVIADEARDRAPWVLEVETSGSDPDEVAAELQAILDDPSAERFKSLEVGWVDHLDEVLDWY